MTGYLSSVCCAQIQVGQSLRRVASVYHVRRESNTHRQTNPIPYSADYFGQKVHIDQNENWSCLVLHMSAVNGFSGKVATMARKNNALYMSTYSCK